MILKYLVDIYVSSIKIHLKFVSHIIVNIMTNIINNLSTILTNSGIDGVLIDAPITATLSYVLSGKLLSGDSLLTSAAIAALAYSIRNIARGKLTNINEETSTPLWGAVAGAMKYGINYYIGHRDSFTTSSFLYTSARGALNVFLYEKSRPQVINILTNDEASLIENTIALGVIFSSIEMIDSVLASKYTRFPSILKECSTAVATGLIIGITTTAFVMLSEIIPDQDKLMIIASSSALYSLRQNPYDMAGVAVAYMLNKATSSFVDMIYEEPKLELAR